MEKALNRDNVVLGVIAALAIFLMVVFYPYYNALRRETVNREVQLSQQFLANQNELGAFVFSFYEQLGVAERKSEQLDNIISGAVQGRYGEDGFSSDGAFFSALSEAYPDLDLALYDDVALYVRTAREDYKNVQNKLLDQARVYRNWLNEDLVRSFLLDSFLRAPTDNLVANVGDQAVFGEAALAVINRPVVPASVNEAYRDGTMAPLRENP